MKDTFDELDRRILARLQRDCSEPLEELGHHIGLSRNATWRRIKRLEEIGVIKGRVALLDADALDVPLMVLLAIRTRHHEAAWSEKFLRTVRAMPEITAAYRTSGDVDYVLEARVADVRAYDRLYQRLIQSIDLEDVSASFVMEELKSTTQLPL